MRRVRARRDEMGGHMSERQWIIISLGGSMISPNTGIDTEFLANFQALSLRLLADGYRLAISTGGGTTCRTYQHAGSAVRDLPSAELDWIGIWSTRLNASLVRAVLYDVAFDGIICDPVDDPIPDDARVIVGGGWKPGCSTDYDTALFARRLGAKCLVNISNVAYVYSQDPVKYANARRYEDMTWTELRTVVGDTWTPGMNVPFDPIAAKLCQEIGIDVFVVSGDDLKNVEHALRGEPFKGTKIHP